MAARYKLKEVPPEEIAFSKTNPRGESAEDISKDASFEQLKDSVYQFGVLVPIVVHEQRKKGRKPYRLVDGERRLRAALATGQQTVPAHIAPGGDAMADLTQAVHIHMLRKQWSLVAQTRAMKRILREVRKKNEGISEAEALERTQELTGCTDTRLKSLRRASHYTDKVLSEVEDGELAFSHLVQFEESFVEKLRERYSDLLSDFGVRHVRDVLLAKARSKVLTGTRALMENVVPVIARAKSEEEQEFVKDLLREFVNRKSMPAEDVLRRFEQRFPKASRDLLELTEEIREVGERMTGMLTSLEAGLLAESFPDAAQGLKDCLSELKNEVSRRLRQLR